MREKMSAMAKVLLALLALVLCASQANAAQPATNQSCAETKKSVSDNFLVVVIFALKKKKGCETK